MKIVLARLQSIKAVALSNGNADAAGAIDQMVALGTPIDIQLPEVLMPPSDPAPAPVPTTVQEAHDAVQAGTITRQDAVGAGVIQTVDQLPPHPDEVPPADPAPAADPVPATVAVDPAPVDPSPPAVVVAPAPDSVIQTVVPDAPVSADVAPVVGPAAVTQSDPGDETPAPVDRLGALEQRVAADEAKEEAFEQEVRSGKVSRQ